MKNKTKLIAKIIFTLAIVAGIAALLLSPSIRKKDYKIVTTIFPLYDITSSIYGEDDVKLIIKPGTELHDYEPTPEDIINIKKADVLIYNGGESEEWIEKILEDTKEGATIIHTMDLVENLEEKHEHEHDEYDEHIWTNPKNVIKIVEKVSSVLSEKYPAKQQKISQNAKDYTAKIQEIDQRFSELQKHNNGNTIVVADRFPFAYFIHEYGFKYITAFSGCSHDAEVSSAKLSELIETIKSQKQKTVYTLELSNQKIANTIKDATGAEIKTLYSGETVTLEDYNNNVGLYELYNRNYETLRALLYATN